MTRLFTAGALACAIAAVSPASMRGAGQEARPKAAASNYTNKYEQSPTFSA
jgi:hypothetical protein